MKCISCSATVSSTMRAAIHSNACPYCGSDIMESKKAKQYSALSSTLAGTKFTNKEEVDQKIKEKVLEVLLDNFEFTKIGKTKAPEVISVEDASPEEDFIEEEVVDQPEEARVPDRAPRSLASAASRRPPSPMPKSNSIYHQAQSDMYEDGDDYGDADDVDPEERAELERYFQDTTPAEIREKVEARLSAAKKLTSPTSNGIKRLR